LSDVSIRRRCFVPFSSWRAERDRRRRRRKRGAKPDEEQLLRHRHGRDGDAEDLRGASETHRQTEGNSFHIWIAPDSAPRPHSDSREFVLYADRGRPGSRGHACPDGRLPPAWRRAFRRGFAGIYGYAEEDLSRRTRRRTTITSTPRGLGIVSCRCAGGWICEEHPEHPWPHDKCPGPGTRCLDDACPWWYGGKPAALDTSDWTDVVRREPKPPARRH
jgi:hypothetical protein